MGQLGCLRRVAVVAFGLALFAAAPASGAPLVYDEKDGYNDIWKASEAVLDKNIPAGEAHVAELRKRPRKDLTPVLLQAEDMAEFALYRKDATKCERCIELLKKVHAAGSDTIWGWAAYGLLDDFDAKDQVKMASYDPNLHLGDIANGVLDFEPKRLETEHGAQTKGAAARLKASVTTELPKGVPVPEDLTRGAKICNAILKAQLVDLCGQETIDGIFAMKDGEKLFARLWDDENTLEAFLLSGPIFDPKLALETLMALYLNDEQGWTSTEEGRKITVATAINVRAPGKKDDPKTVFVNRLRCYAAYRRLSQRRLFHETAAKRDTREWRFIVRDPTSAADILYLNSRPFDHKRTGSTINQVPYRYRNCFGGHIQSRSGRYYDPWRFADWPYWYMVHRVGGICNRQSTYGAVCANAHGLMAEHAGQPNHCAWLLRDEAGVWTIRNDINKFTAGVFMLWGRGYQYVQATERAFADRTAFERSELLRFLHHNMLAISACPYNLSAWRDYTDELKAKKASPEAWHQYLAVLAKTTPEGRTPTWDFAFEALDELRKSSASDDAVLAELVALIKALPEPEKTIPEEMNYRGGVMRRATGLFKKDTERQLNVLAAGLAANWGTRHYFSQCLQQGLDTFAKDEAACKRLFDEVTKKYSDEKMDAKGIDFRPLIETASRSRQRDAFQTLAMLRNRLDPPPAGAPWPQKDFGGRLVSDKGIIYTSRRGRGDSPQDYPRVIDASPLKAKRTYQIAMEPRAEPWAVVELPGACKIAGIVVTGDKMVSTTVWVSENGESWDLVKTDGTDEKGGLRVDLSEAHAAAKYVRVGRVRYASTESLRLAKILVYGETLY